MSVSVSRLFKSFDRKDLPAVRDASFTAPSGAITTLLGPSGSGKTTALRLIAGLEHPDSGQITFFGDDYTRVPVQRRGVGMVFQGYALFGHLTVEENIAFGLTLQKLPRAEIAARTNEWLKIVQLENFARRRPAELSGGQRQRVALARTLAPRPRVLLLDEPFGALDARVRLELREWLLALHEKMHVTTILVTHDQEEALELSEHVVVMNEGRVEQAGAPHEIYDQPASAFVASFIGNPSVLHGRVEAGRAAIGASTFAAPRGSLDGARVRAFVRPHEVRLTKPAALHRADNLAVIERLTRIGGHVRIDIRLPSEEAMCVQLPYGEVAGFVAGDRVIVDLGAAKIFAEESAAG